MINFCKCFLGSSDSRHFSLPSPNGLIIIASGDLNRPPHVVTSSSVKPASNRDPDQDPNPNHWLGFDGVADGMLSCTESLGFESLGLVSETGSEREILPVRSRSGKPRERKLDKERARFPPPISSFNQRGVRTFLRPEKKDGRLLITEVRIERQEILRAERQDGRLRLQLIKPPEEEKEEESESDNGEDEDQCQREDLAVLQWPLPLRRCQEMMTRHHHHHHLPHWSQRCVTTICVTTI